ncbi:MAG: DUF1934 domain-containing protein [Clostridia bacterium]|nr:DUF1934 domain-containing protein [Clostridia bacterium]
MKTENNAIVSVKGIQYIDGEKLETELVAEGYYKYSPEKISVIYNEYDRDTGIKTISELTVTGGHIVLCRDGGQNTRMEFEKGVKCVGYYELPFGSFNISTTVSSIENNLTVMGGSLYISYNLSLDRLTTTQNDITVSVRLKG